MSIICPKGKGYEKSFEEIDGIAIYRHPQPFEGNGALGYLAEYSWALLAEFALSLRVLMERGFDAIHACNPPDTLFLIGGFYKLFGKKFLFDHHDINPELYEAKFRRRDLFYRLMLWLERTHVQDRGRVRRDQRVVSPDRDRARRALARARCSSCAAAPICVVCACCRRRPR